MAAADRPIRRGQPDLVGDQDSTRYGLQRRERVRSGVPQIVGVVADGLSAERRMIADVLIRTSAAFPDIRVTERAPSSSHVSEMSGSACHREEQPLAEAQRTLQPIRLHVYEFSSKSNGAA